MPAVCRFYLKGYCRYGTNCRFEHPGENKQANSFSFTKALEETKTGKTTNFSFTKALEETTNNPYPFANNQQQFYSSTPYHFNSGQQHSQPGGFNYPYNQSGIFNQTYHHHQQYNSNTFGNNTFSFAAAAAGDPTVRYNSFSDFGGPSHFYPGQTRQCIDEVDMRLPGEQHSQNDSTQLTELELRAYQIRRRSLRKSYNSMADRYNIQSQLEHLQSKQVGTGHPDTQPHEMLVNQHRDTYCTYLGRQDMLSYFAVAEGESRARLRFNFQKKLIQPCGPPPEKPQDDE